MSIRGDFGLRLLSSGSLCSSLESGLFRFRIHPCLEDAVLLLELFEVLTHFGVSLSSETCFADILSSSPAASCRTVSSVCRVLISLLPLACFGLCCCRLHEDLKTLAKANVKGFSCLCLALL